MAGGARKSGQDGSVESEFDLLIFSGSFSENWSMERMLESHEVCLISFSNESNSYKVSLFVAQSVCF